jgi:hypothetical protein
MSCTSFEAQTDLKEAEQDCAKRALVLLEFLGFTATDSVDAGSLQEWCLAELGSCWPEAQVILEDESGRGLAAVARQERKRLVGHHCSVKKHLLDPEFNLKEIQSLCHSRGPSWMEPILVLAFAEEALGLAADQSTNSNWALCLHVWRASRFWLDSVFQGGQPDWKGFLQELQVSGASAFPLLFHLTVPEMLKRVCMNLALLQDHLSCEDKYCPDCLCKHALLAEAFVRCVLLSPHPDQVCTAVAPLWPYLVALRKVAESDAARLKKQRRLVTQLTCHFLKVVQSLK